MLIFKIVFKVNKVTCLTRSHLDTLTSIWMPWIVAITYSDIWLHSDWEWPWPHDLQNVISLSSRCIGYLCKIWTTISFHSFQSYYFYTWPWSYLDFWTLWPVCHGCVIFVSFSIAYWNLMMILQAVQEIRGPRVFHVWLYSDLDHDPLTFKTQAVRLLPQYIIN